MLKAIGHEAPAVTHGFRSCLKDWCHETTSFPHEVVEQALGHRIKSTVERSYRRGDLFERRRALMAAWDRYCNGEVAAEVIELRGLNPVATRRPAQPLYAVFLERVIKIQAVQRHRAAVTDDDTAGFFTEGRRPGLSGDFLWSLDAPSGFPWGPLSPFEPATLSPPMQLRGTRRSRPLQSSSLRSRNGELIASGVHPEPASARDLDPAEWTR